MEDGGEGGGGGYRKVLNIIVSGLVCGGGLVVVGGWRQWEGVCVPRIAGRVGEGVVFKGPADSLLWR